MVVAAQCAKAIISPPPRIARSPERSVSSLWSRVFCILVCCCCLLHPHFVEVKWSSGFRPQLFVRPLPSSRIFQLESKKTRLI